MNSIKEDFDNNPNSFEFSIAESVREKMTSVATEHANSFDEFLWECESRQVAIGDGLRQILGYFSVLCEEWEVQHPTSRITALTSPAAAEEFLREFSHVIFTSNSSSDAPTLDTDNKQQQGRHEMEFDGLPWTEERISVAIREFADLIGDFNEFERNKASRTDISFNLADSPLTTARIHLLGSNASLSSLKGERGRLFDLAPRLTSPETHLAIAGAASSSFGLPLSLRSQRESAEVSRHEQDPSQLSEGISPGNRNGTATPPSPHNSSGMEKRNSTSETVLEARSTISNFVACLPFTEPMKSIKASDWANFLSEPIYEEEKADAIYHRNATKLVQLFFQDRPSTQYGLITLAEMEVGAQLTAYTQFLEADDDLSYNNNMGMPARTTTSEYTDDSDTLMGGNMKSYFAHHSNPHFSGGKIGGGGGGGFSSSGSWAKAELEKYRTHHLELTDANPPISQNVDFYRGARPHPSYHDFIDDFHNVEKYRGQSAATTTKSTWHGCYQRLEAEHSFIQHLFPIQEGKGMSSNSQRLQKHEIDTMKRDTVIQERIVRSFETICDFFGIQVERQAATLRTEGQGDAITFGGNVVVLRRSDHYEHEFDNLNFSSHNYLRITRICKFLGDVGLEQCQEALVDFFIQECFEIEDEEEVWLPNLRSSLEQFWVETIRSDEVRQRFADRILLGKQRLQEKKLSGDKEKDL